MPEPPTIPVVPEPEQNFTIVTRPVENPFNNIWWATQTAVRVPESVMGWLVAQGWRITQVLPDNSTVPPTVYYNMETLQLSPLETIKALCDSFKINAEDARQVNEFRYNAIVSEWSQLAATTHDHFVEQIEEQNAAVGVYITDLLNPLMSEVDNLSDANIDRLNSELSSHEDDTRKLLEDLGATEEARIREEYVSKLSVSVQDLIDRGLYTSAVYEDIRTRNHRDRDEQIQMLKDRLNREKLVNEHQLYGQQETLADHRHRAIVEKMNIAAAKLDGWSRVSAENRQLMAYQLDERNKLLIGLYSFVERRSDIGPEWKDMASMIAGLGDSAGGWIQP